MQNWNNNIFTLLRRFAVRLLSCKTSITFRTFVKKEGILSFKGIIVMEKMGVKIVASLAFLWCVVGITGQASNHRIFMTDQLHCESLVCSSGAVECQVMRGNDPQAPSQVVTIRKCLSPSGRILSTEVEINQPTLDPRNPVNVVTIWRLGVPVTSRRLTEAEEIQFRRAIADARQEGRLAVASAKKDIGNAMRDIDNAYADVAGAMDQVHDTVEPFQNGSFLENLKNKIVDSVKKSLDF